MRFSSLPTHKKQPQWSILCLLLTQILQADPQPQSHLIWWTGSHQHKETRTHNRDGRSGLMIKNINSGSSKESVSIVVQQHIRFVPASFYQCIDPRSTLNSILLKQELLIFLMLCWKKKMDMKPLCWEKSSSCTKSCTGAPYSVDEEGHLETRLARV